MFNSELKQFLHVLPLFFLAHWSEFPLLRLPLGPKKPREKPSHFPIPFLFVMPGSKTPTLGSNGCFAEIRLLIQRPFFFFVFVPS